MSDYKFVVRQLGNKFYAVLLDMDGNILLRSFNYLERYEAKKIIKSIINNITSRKQFVLSNSSTKNVYYWQVLLKAKNHKYIAYHEEEFNISGAERHVDKLISAGKTFQNHKNYDTAI